MFINNITELLVNKLPLYQNSIILGNFNIHIEDLTNANAVILNDTMTTLGLEQYISGQTHVKGNTLDLIFMQLSNSFDITNTTLHGFISDHCMVSVNINIKKQKYPIDITNTTLHGFISDHCMVSVNINIKKQKYPIETKKIGDRTKITGPTLAQNFTPPEFNEDTTIDEATSQCNTELLKARNAISPIKCLKFTNRPKISMV